MTLGSGQREKGRREKGGRGGEGGRICIEEWKMMCLAACINKQLVITIVGIYITSSKTLLRKYACGVANLKASSENYFQKHSVKNAGFVSKHVHFRKASGASLGSCRASFKSFVADVQQRSGNGLQKVASFLKMHTISGWAKHIYRYSSAEIPNVSSSPPYSLLQQQDIAGVNSWAMISCTNTTVSYTWRSTEALEHQCREIYPIGYGSSEKTRLRCMSSAQSHARDVMLMHTSKYLTTVCVSSTRSKHVTI